MTHNLFREKKIYKEGYPNLYKFNAKPIDMWYHRSHYGKIDTHQNIVYLSADAKQTKLKQLKVSGPGEEILLAVDFVAEAFNDFKSHFIKTDVFGRLREDGSIRELRQVRALVHAESEYDKYFLNISDAFILRYLNENPEINQSVVDFKSFLKEFMNFARDFSNSFPITKTGMIKSRFCTPHVSGLMIEVDLLNHDKDLDKYGWTEDINFNFYRNTARKFGFLVDKNAPWRLVADIASLPMQRYWEKSRILDPSNVKITEESVDFEDDCWETESRESVTFYPPQEEWKLDPPDLSTWTKKVEVDFYGNKKTTEIKGTSSEKYKYPNSVPHFFSEYYNKSHMTDLGDLKKHLLKMYNDMVRKFPTINISKRKGCIANSKYVTEKMVHKKIERKFINENSEDYKRHTEYDWLKIYMDLRVLEEDVSLSAGTYRGRLRQLKKIFKYIDKENLDNGNALCYINEQTKQLVYKPVLEKGVSPSGTAVTPSSNTGTTSAY